MLRKNWSALGSFLKEDRPRALDLLGFASQLVFNTFLSDYLCDVEHERRSSTSPTASRAAHNRAMVDFCSVDRRLLAVGYVPLADFARAPRDGARTRSRWAARRCWCRRPARRRIRRATSDSSRCGRWREDAGLPIVLPRRRRRAPARSRATSTTACRRCPTSTAAPRTSARSTTWRSRTRRCRPSRR